ncbi:MAG: GAF domain-containing protein [Dehalococcoidia bacterium]|nr:GAF domain-containing protein [Dehalococcoidia bacterium]
MTPDDELAGLRVRNAELEQRLREMQVLLDILPVGVGFALDRDCLDIRANRAFAEMLDVSTEENTSKSGPHGDTLPFRVFKNGQEVPAEDLPLQYAARTGETVYHDEYEILHSDGHVTTLLEFAAPLYDIAGEIHGAVGAFIDISDRRRAEHQLQLMAAVSARLTRTLSVESAVADTLRLLVPELADVAVIDIVEGPYARRTTWSTQEPGVVDFARELDTTAPRLDDPNDIVARAMRQREPVYLPVVPPGGLPLGRSARGNADAEPTSAIIVPLIARDHVLGTLSLVYLRRSRRRYDHVDVEFVGELAGRIATWLNAARLYDEARTAARAKDEFLGMVSHELKTPLTVIRGYSGSVSRYREALGPEEQEQLFAEIHREAERLNRMVENMLVLSRFHLNERPLFGPVLLQRVLPDVARRFEKLHGRLVHVVAPPDLPVVEGEITYVEQIVANLLSNADKYAPPGETIEVVAAPAGEMVRVQVVDHGPGVPEDDRRSIFEPFFRGQQAEGPIQGVGLGLAVARVLVEAQGGTIGLESSDGDGAVFAFSLPVSRDPR